MSEKTLEILVSAIMNAPELRTNDFRDIVLAGLINAYKAKAPICLDSEEMNLPTVVQTKTGYAPIPKEQAFEIFKCLDRRHSSQVISASKAAYIKRVCHENTLDDSDMEALNYIAEIMDANKNQSLYELLLGDAEQVEVYSISHLDRTVNCGILKMVMSSLYMNRMAKIYAEKVLPYFRMLN